MKMKKVTAMSMAALMAATMNPVSTGYGRRRRKGLLPQLQTRAG